MTYRELMMKLLRSPPEVLDQNIVIFDEGTELFYGCTGSDVSYDDQTETLPNGHFFLMVNI